MNTLFLKHGYAFVTISSEERDLYFDSIENNTLHEFLAYKMEKQLLDIKRLHQEKINETDDDYER